MKTLLTVAFLTLTAVAGPIGRGTPITLASMERGDDDRMSHTPEPAVGLLVLAGVAVMWAKRRRV